MKKLKRNNARLRARGSASAFYISSMGRIGKRDSCLVLVAGRLCLSWEGWCRRGVGRHGGRWRRDRASCKVLGGWAWAAGPGRMRRRSHEGTHARYWAAGRWRREGLRGTAARPHRARPHPHGRMGTCAGLGGCAAGCCGAVPAPLRGCGLLPATLRAPGHRAVRRLTVTAVPVALCLCGTAAAGAGLPSVLD
jgi:hypothetical protein